MRARGVFCAFFRCAPIQIPFDATVRVSLDTNLTMVLEGGDRERWFRDPRLPVPKNEVTRFPHAVLEVKLQLEEEGGEPAWVSDLIASGMLVRVHKFSKVLCYIILYYTGPLVFQGAAEKKKGGRGGLTVPV